MVSCLLTSCWLNPVWTNVAFCLQPPASLSYLWLTNAASRSHLLYLGCVVASPLPFCSTLVYSAPLCFQPRRCSSSPLSPRSARLSSTGTESGTTWSRIAFLYTTCIGTDKTTVTLLLLQQPTFILLMSSVWVLKHHFSRLQASSRNLLPLSVLLQFKLSDLDSVCRTKKAKTHLMTQLIQIHRYWPIFWLLSSAVACSHLKRAMLSLFKN